MRARDTFVTEHPAVRPGSAAFGGPAVTHVLRAPGDRDRDGIPAGANPFDDEDLPRPRTAEPAHVMRAAALAAARGERVAMATVLVRRGSTPSTPGQKLMIAESGACVGTIGGGAVERAVLLELLSSVGGVRRRSSEPPAADVERERAPAIARVATFKLGPELGMCCGGSVEVLIEVIASPTPAIIVGAGHIGSALAPLLARCGFVVTLTDEREGWVDAPEGPSVDGMEGPSDVGEGDGGRDEVVVRPPVRRVAGDFDAVGRSAPRSGVVLVMTHDHQLDQRVVEWALRERFAFVGGVGSRAKCARIRARLEAKGFAREDIDRLRMPLGVDIGARSPEEIAVSIAAELIGWRRGVPERARPTTPTTGGRNP